MDAESHEREFITLQQLSDRSGRSSSSLRRDVRKGRIEAIQPGGRGGKLFFRPDALQACRLAGPQQQTISTQSQQIGRLAGRRPCWMSDSTSIDPPTTEA
jgi:hypothetical protein